MSFKSLQKVQQDEKKTIFLFMYFADIHEENFTKREKKQECILYYFVINVVIFVRR